MAIAPLYANAVIDYLTAKGAPSAITGLYLDLYDGDPLTTGTSVLDDLTGSATRTNVASAFPVASAGTSTNDTEIDVTAAAVSGANVLYVAFFSAATDGNLIATQGLGNPQTVTVGNGVSFPIGSIQIAFG